jgi:hypothetical protein
MNQRGFVIPGLMAMLPWIIGGIAAAALAGWLWWKIDNHCNRACRNQQDIAQAAILRVGDLEQAIAEAQKRATDLALLWSEAIQHEKVRFVETIKWQTRVFTQYRERTTSVGASGSIRLSDDARVLLGDAARSSGQGGASAAPAAGDRSPDAPAPAPSGGEVDTTAQEWVAWSVAVAEWASEARAKHQFCVEAYGKIREASNE